MDILFGRSYEDGIDFHIEHRYDKFVVSAKNENGKITAKRENEDYIREKKNNKKLTVAIIAILLAIVYHFTGGSYIGIVVSLWALTIAYFVINFRKNKNKKVFKYHAVEHKILNYYSYNRKVPTKVEDIKNENSLTLFCGSTAVAVFLMEVSIILLLLNFATNIFFAIFLFVVFTVFNMVLWAFGKLNFFQKLSIIEPTNAELKLGIEAMKELLEIVEAYKLQSP